MATNTPTNNLVKVLDWLAIAALVGTALAAFFLYGNNTGAGAAATPEEANAIRIEIQRYLGYEILPVRYLSLPYDLVMNSNVYLAILDTGVLLLIFVPIAILLGFLAKPGSPPNGKARRWEAPLLATAVVVSCFFLMVISTANGYIADKNMKIVKPTEVSEYLANTSFGEAPVGVTCAHLYQQCLRLYQGAVEPVLLRFSGNADAVTYPLLILVFALFFYIGSRRFRHLPMPEQGLLYFTYAYLFFWLMLSAGIVWYGLLAFPLLTAFVFSVMLGKGKGEGLAGKVGRYLFLATVAVSLVIGFAHRFSNLTLTILSKDKIAGKRIYDPAYVQYITGDFTEENVYDAYYPGLGRALRSINTEDKSLIYNVGGRFNFFIRANDKRMFNDNQLDFFNQIITKYKNKEQVTALLKASGFRYLIVDFNTPSGDRTPEQLLVERYKKFMLLLYENPGLEMLATNRVIKETSGGATQYIYGVFGEVQDPGTFAIYRIK
ncbi:MAG: hypothetical protein H6577_28200 [Lewinellaceae bacterium]|nr:hypothetical protein [Saprospiraceae bacterium]MCB9342029.1 hypothetical protein [Lewinellaceae bacterium]